MDEQPSTGSGRTSGPTGSAVDRKPTRVSWTWFTLIVGVILGIALVDFVVQNTRLESVEFFSVSGRVPIAVALLVAALCGAAVVLVVGIARMGQLRRTLHKQGNQPTDGPVAVPHAGSIDDRGLDPHGAASVPTGSEAASKGPSSSS